MSHRVHVTEDDYRAAVRQSSGKCAVARAVRRTFPTAGRVMVDIQTIRFTLEGERLTWLTPPMGQDMIVAFDGGEWSRLEPFSFDLRHDRAFQIRRHVFATEEEREQSNKARREGKSRAGMGQKTTKGIRPPKRSTLAAKSRAYGARALSINQYRAQDGVLGEVEAIPEAS